MRRSSTTALLALLLLIAGRALAADEVVHGRLTVERGQAVVAATIAPGWHVNAHVPRDKFLIPTTLELKPPSGMHAGEVTYPEPVERKLAFMGGETALLYEGSLRFTATLD